MKVCDINDKRIQDCSSEKTGGECGQEGVCREEGSEGAEMGQL